MSEKEIEYQVDLGRDREEVSQKSPKIWNRGGVYQPLYRETWRKDDI